MINLILAFLIGMLVFLSFMLYKNDVTCRNQLLISDAIYRYNVHVIEEGLHTFLVDYGDIEPYGRTLWRLWDFGYENILPKHLYEVVRPFIKEEKEKENA